MINAALRMSRIAFCARAFSSDAMPLAYFVEWRCQWLEECYRDLQGLKPGGVWRLMSRLPFGSAQGEKPRPTTLALFSAGIPAEAC